MKRIIDADMRDYTSFKAGGKAAELIIAENTDELRDIMSEINSGKKKYAILGNGSNTLVTDKGFDGIIVKLDTSYFSNVSVDDNVVTAGSGILMSALAKILLRENLSGFEFASGIPGSLGGAVFMNAGAYGGEMKDIITSVRVVKKDGSCILEIPKDKLQLSYRHSILSETGDIVVDATLKLSKGQKEEIAAKMTELTKKRNDKQPVQYPSAGSFFKRPEGYFAGKLIEDAGCKGLSVGGAQISQKHSGFMINTGNATATDIIQLMHLVQNTVYDKFKVHLEPEVRIIGD